MDGNKNDMVEVKISLVISVYNCKMEEEMKKI